MTSNTVATSDPIAVGAREAARLCGISPRSWWRLVAMGKTPPGYKLGGRRVWRIADLKAWAANGFALEGGEP